VDNQWKIDRRTGIGGSDAAAILGLSPWKSAMQVWLEKKGLAEEKDPAREFLLALGKDLEPVIARLYERETGKQLDLPFPVHWIHPVHKILMGTPDRFVAGVDRGVELKSENQFADQFGEPGTDQVPYHYLIQCAHYMAVTDYPVWDIALLHGGVKFSIYTIERDAELEHDMIEQLRDWWDRYIVADQPPDIDGSAAWKVYLRKKFPLNLLPIKENDITSQQLIFALGSARRVVEEYSEYQAEAENRLKMIIGEHDGIQGDFGRITWKKTKDREDVDWKIAFLAISEEYKKYCPIINERKPSDVCDAVIKACTTLRQGSRRFLFQPNEEWEHHGQRGEETRSGEIAGTRRALPGGDRQLGSGGTSGSDDKGALYLRGKASKRP